MSLLTLQDYSIDIQTPNGVLHAVKKVSLSLEKQQTLALVGESGSGKSLTAMGILNLLPRAATRSASELTFQGKDLLSAPASALRKIRGKDIGFIFQEPMTSLNPVFTIGRQLIDVYLAHGMGSPAEAHKRAVYLLERVGVRSAKGRMTQYPLQLSGGLRQRVMIAMALMCEPSLLIADEPTTALDTTVQAELLKLLTELQDELGIAILLITHDFGIVAHFADKVAVMYSGAVVEQGSAEDVIKNPQHAYTRALMECVPKPTTAPLSVLPTIKDMVMPSTETAGQGGSI